MKFVIGSRGSKLALAQVEIVIAQLRQQIKEQCKGEFGNLVFEKKIIKTTGDKIKDAPLAKIGGKGIFVKEIDEALVRGEIDFAVHSMKDVPTELMKGIEIASIPKREERNDVLISKYFLHELKKDSTIGTSSLRRKAELLHYSKDFKTAELRGNVDTRLRKLNEGVYDAIVMAKAGLKRLGFEKHIKQDLPLDKFPHAVGQGAIAIASREDFAYKGLLKMLEDETTRREVEAERALLKAIGGGCQVPLGVVTKVKNSKIILSASIFSQDGKTRVDAKVEETSTIKAGEKAAKILLEKGGEKIIKELDEKAC